jgi:hypothetical protein
MEAASGHVASPPTPAGTAEERIVREDVVREIMARLTRGKA